MLLLGSFSSFSAISLSMHFLLYPYHGVFLMVGCLEIGMQPSSLNARCLGLDFIGVFGSICAAAVILSFCVY